MRKLLMSTIIATTAMLGGVAMAQDSVGRPSYQSLPDGTYFNGTPGTEFRAVSPGTGAVAPNANAAEATPYFAYTYVPQWSANPGVFNTETSDPGFVEHDHGHP